MLFAGDNILTTALESAVKGALYSATIAMTIYTFSYAISAFISWVKVPNTSASTDATTSQCFIEGTLVETVDGSIPIEEINVGDKVLSYNEETGEKALKEVVRLFRNETTEWCHVSIEGMEEAIVSTSGHKYYLPENTVCRAVGEKHEHAGYDELSVKWVSACNLKKGDKVLLSDGRCGIISKIELEYLFEPETTYNFEVEDFHTYYVGEQGILVHNMVGLDCGGDVLKNGELFERSFDVNGKTIDVLANTRIEGSNLFLDDMVMYARGGDAANQIGYAGIKNIGREINGLAAQQGFESITYSFTRVANSSSAMKGIPLIWGPFRL